MEKIWQIIEVQTDDELEHVRTLWREYGDFLKICFAERAHLSEFKEYHRNYEQEIASSLPGSYGSDSGCLLLAEYSGEPAGCVGLRDLGDCVCEMKRLFVKPQYRGLGIGKTLAKALLEQSKLKGYKSMRLDTNQRMPAAIGLYRTLGFRDIAPYEYFDVDGMVYLELPLR